jgi:hypothetical protein
MKILRLLFLRLFLCWSRSTTHTSPVRSIIPVVSLASSPHLAPEWKRVTTNAWMSGGRCGRVFCTTSQETDPGVPLVSLPPRPGYNNSTVTSRWSTSTGTSSRETPHRKTCLVRRVIALIVWRASDFLMQLSRNAINLVGPKDATGRVPNIFRSGFVTCRKFSVSRVGSPDGCL